MLTTLSPYDLGICRRSKAVLLAIAAFNDKPVDRRILMRTTGYSSMRILNDAIDELKELGFVSEEFEVLTLNTENISKQIGFYLQDSTVNLPLSAKNHRDSLNELYCLIPTGELTRTQAKILLASNIPLTGYELGRVERVALKGYW